MQEPTPAPAKPKHVLATTMPSASGLEAAAAIAQVIVHETPDPAVAAVEPVESTTPLELSTRKSAAASAPSVRATTSLDLASASPERGERLEPESRRSIAPIPLVRTERALDSAAHDDDDEPFDDVVPTQSLPWGKLAIGLGVLLGALGLLSALRGGSSGGDETKALAPVTAPPSVLAASAAPTPSAPAPTATQTAEKHEPALVRSAEEPASEAPPIVDAAKYKELKNNALGLLSRSRFSDAERAARLMVEADPSDATGYLYLGTALLEQRKKSEAMEVKATCLKIAKKGPINECTLL